MADVFLLNRHFNHRTNRRLEVLRHRHLKLSKAKEENRNDPLAKISVEECRERYRFRPDSIRKIENAIHDDVVRRTGRSLSLSPMIQLLVTLRFLASGAFYNMVGDTLLCHKSSVCRVVKVVCRSILHNMIHLVSMPTITSSINIKAAYKAIAGIPNLIGCVDGTFIRIHKPKINTQEFICRKGFAAINVQVSLCYIEGSIQFITKLMFVCYFGDLLKLLYLDLL